MTEQPLTVRLPMYNSDGMPVSGYLEVDVEFFLALSRTTIRYNAKIVKPEEPPIFEEGLLGSYEEAKTQMDQENEILSEKWHCLDGLIPSRAFEINELGVIRIKSNKKIILPNWFDIDNNRDNVMLKINGMEYYLDGFKIAEELRNNTDIMRKLDSGEEEWTYGIYRKAKEK